MASIAVASATKLLLPQQQQFAPRRLNLASHQQTRCSYASKPLTSFASISHRDSMKFNSNVWKEDDRSSFAKTAAVRHLVGSLTKAEGHRFAIVVARFNEVVTRLLLEGALDAFKRYSVKDENIDVVWVPGSFEIPLAAERLGKLGKYQAIICIGAVVRGDTSHYDAVANSVASGVLSAGLNSGVPCVFGVLTTEDMDQALNRAGGKVGNKGAEAALTAIEMVSLFEHHLKLC